MLIPEYKPASAAGGKSEFTQFETLDQYKKLRTATTDKAILVLFAAEWDESSQLLKQMLQERANQELSGMVTTLLAWVDCDAGEDLVEHFDIDVVPSLVVLLPHKQQPEVLAGVTPDQLNGKVAQLDSFIKTLFEEEKALAFREIDSLVKNNPVMMFIKGTLDTPKCKFTRRLVNALAPRNLRNLKTFNILEDERIR